MPSLADLLAGVDGARVVAGDPATPVNDVRDDSRAVAPGDLFIAVPGTRADGRQFIAQALERGAAVVVVEGAPPPAQERAAHPGVAWVSVPSARQAVGPIAARRLGRAGQLRLAAVTGTNGKTTVTYLLESILEAAGRRPGVIGTVNYRFGGRLVPAPLTTPGALAMQGLLADMQGQGATDVAMEVTSIALDQGRVAGCKFKVAGLTNVTQDHLDYHGTLDRYFAAKARLFGEQLTEDGVAVLFVDREDGRRMRPHVRGRVLTVSLDPAVAADVTVTGSRLAADGTTASFATPAGALAITSSLVGGFNLANLALAVAMALALEVPPADIQRGLGQQRLVPGRLEPVPNAAGVLCVVDYAHTPDALERALEALRPLTTGRLLVVFGCGGDRDSGKRPLMGKAAVTLGDLAVVTSDNPRTEDPRAILNMVVAGIRPTAARELDAPAVASAARGYLVEQDRRVAIRLAVLGAHPGDTVLIAGKGHEDYQILVTGKIHFDDREEAASAFAARAAGGGRPGSAA
jgi:UDP-N-acetylmuramoyl-L-alanyl-D-glutamate--2,6-diaminopimelate ligase